MKLPISIAQKLQLLQQGNTVPAAQMRHSVVDKMVDDGIIQKQRTGNNRNLYFISQQANLGAYLFNHFGIADLDSYVVGYVKKELTRSEAVAISSDSKLRSIRTFKGFLVNSFEPIEALLNGVVFIVNPSSGTFQFIRDFESFVPDPKVVVVGVENPENFSRIGQQRYLFEGQKVLFISRYPQSQSGDVMKWLLNISNQYLHYGDFDFEGINIYLREFKKHLRERAHFFVPESIAEALSAKGNRDLYNRQLHHQPDLSAVNEQGIVSLLNLIHQYKKVLEQEALILS